MKTADAFIGFKLPQAERELFIEAARRCGVSLSEYLRRCASSTAEYSTIATERRKKEDQRTIPLFA
jgi:hypothetical protein